MLHCSPQAISSAGLTAPYTNNQDLYSILTYHILPLALPTYNAFNASAHYIAETIAPITATSDVGADLVLQKGKTEGQISVVALKGESTITGEIGKGDQAGALGGLTLMSVDTVSSIPALTSLRPTIVLIVHAPPLYRFFPHQQASQKCSAHWPKLQPRTHRPPVYRSIPPP